MLPYDKTVEARTLNCLLYVSLLYIILYSRTVYTIIITETQISYLEYIS